MIRQGIARVRNLEWDQLSIGGQPHGHICPICGCVVPVGNDGFGVSRKSRHIDWHETLERDRDNDYWLSLGDRDG